jgi:hypothetical protein
MKNIFTLRHRVVAVQSLKPFEKANFETTISHFIGSKG